MLDLARLLMSVAGLFIPAGLVMLMSGRVKYRNELDTNVRILTAFSLSLICYWLVGYGLLNGDTFHGFVGWNGSIIGRSDLLSGEADLRVVSLFTIPPIAAACAMTERGSVYSGNLLVVIVAVLVAPVTTHWSWPHEGGTGWLMASGFQDAGGSVVIFLSAGFVAVAISLVLGPRMGRFPEEGGRPRGHSPTWHGLGAICLVTALVLLTAMRAESLQDISAAIFVFFLGASFATIAGSLMMKILRSNDTTQDLTTSVLSGTVALTSVASYAEPVDAALTGILAGALSVSFKRILAASEIDDPGELISAFLSGGLIGCLLAPLAWAGLMDSLTQHLVTQLIGIGAIAAWSFGVAFIFALILKRFFNLRVSEADEKRGLSVAHYGYISEPDYVISAFVRSYGREYHNASDHDGELSRLSEQFSKAIIKLHGETGKAQDRIVFGCTNPQKAATMVSRIRLAEDSVRVKAEDILMLMENLLSGPQSQRISEDFSLWQQEVLEILLEPLLQDLEKLVRHLPLQAELDELEGTVITSVESMARCAHNIELLRDLSEAQSSGYFSQDHPCDLAVLLQEKTERIIALSEIHNRPVQIDCPVKSGLMVNGDANGFAKLMSLTVEGAFNRLLKQAQRPIRLELREHSSGNYIVLDCIDTGTTLSTRQIHCIKDPLSESLRLREIGLPQILPLILVARIVAAVGGEFAISSEYGAGTILRCRFRKSKVKARAAAAA
ncbi:hypothetical protein [uncultured Cohaesibacter sp.]|uniref:hypothetical protein n=1 Tax=uncultured Cohaesibacter sp. TaxID=1002546 RepID=UPI00292F7671|nr:hypothetical protein [uncultured Cohaesibacter sp.]